MLEFAPFFKKAPYFELAPPWSNKNFVHKDDHIPPTYKMTPSLKHIELWTVKVIS